MIKKGPAGAGAVQGNSRQRRRRVLDERVGDAGGRVGVRHAEGEGGTAVGAVPPAQMHGKVRGSVGEQNGGVREREMLEKRRMHALGGAESSGQRKPGKSKLAAAGWLRSWAACLDGCTFIWGVGGVREGGDITCCFWVQPRRLSCSAVRFRHISGGGMGRGVGRLATALSQDTTLIRWETAEVAGASTGGAPAGAAQRGVKSPRACAPARSAPSPCAHGRRGLGGGCASGPGWKACRRAEAHADGADGVGGLIVGTGVLRPR